MQSSGCAACLGTVTKHLGHVPDGEMYRCQTCGSLSLDGREGPDSYQPAGYGSAYHEGHDALKAPRLLEMLREATTNIEELPKTLLDVGCGYGEFLELAMEDRWDVCGVDSDQQAVEIVQNRQLPAITGTLGESLAPFGEFSVVTLWDVIEHIPDVDEAMSWLSSTVAPGGKLIILTPNANCLLDSFAHLERTLTLRGSQRLIHLCLNRYHLHRFTAEGLSRLVIRFGFVPEKVNPVQLFSLRPESYLTGFAPGMPGWTSRASLNKLLSVACYEGIKMLGIKNKILLTCRRTSPLAVDLRAKQVGN